MNISYFYAKLFCHGFLARINDKILLLALKAKGYNNFRSSKESGELFFIRQILAPAQPRLCMDIGANTGRYTSNMVAYTSAKIIAFEPLPPAFEKLKETTKEVADRVKIENLGVGDANDSLTIHYNPNALSHASFSEDTKKVSYVTNEEKAVVPVVTLDSYCDSHDITEIDFIKIDTEGYEAEVFEGAKHLFSTIKPKFIQIEFNWHQLFRNTSLNYFAEKLPDYDVYQLLPDSWIKRDPKDPLTNLYYFSNFVFVRRD